MCLRAFFLSMRAVRLDDETADRMLAGDVDPADAPPGYAAVAELLETARTAAGMPVPASLTAHRPSDLGVIQATSAGRAAGRTRSRRRSIPVLAAVALRAGRRARDSGRFTDPLAKAWRAASEAFAALGAIIEEMHAGSEPTTDHPDPA